LAHDIEHHVSFIDHLFDRVLLLHRFGSQSDEEPQEAKKPYHENGKDPPRGVIGFPKVDGPHYDEDRKNPARDDQTPDDSLKPPTHARRTDSTHDLSFNAIRFVGRQSVSAVSTETIEITFASAAPPQDHDPTYSEQSDGTEKKSEHR